LYELIKLAQQGRYPRLTCLPSTNNSKPLLPIASSSRIWHQLGKDWRHVESHL